MNRDLEIIIESIQAMQLTPEQIRAELAKQSKRGALAAVYREIGGTEEEQHQSCCSQAEEATETDPETTNPWSDPNGNAPKEYTTTPEGVTDCETGQPVQMNFTGGFTLAESCKECGPDETWQEGFYWRGSEPIEEGVICGASPHQAWSNYPDSYYSNGHQKTFYKQPFDHITGNTSFGVSYKATDGTTGVSRNVTQYECTSGAINTYPCAGPACAYTIPPDICGDSWAVDGSTQLTIRNGCIVGSKCDPDAATSDLGCNDCRDLCKDGVKWRFCATSDGGWVQYDPDGIRTGGKYKVGEQFVPIPPGEESNYL